MPMIKHILSFILLAVSPVLVSAQSELKDHIIGGNSLYHQKDYEKAELKYRQALSKDNNSIKGNYNLGNALYQQGKFDEARSHYQKVLKNPKATNKDKEKANYNIGRSYLDERRFNEAEYHFKEALKLNPYDENTRENYNLAKKEIHPEDLMNREGDGSEKDPDNTQRNPQNRGEKENEAAQKDGNEGSQNKDGENGDEEGSGNRPQDQQITKGSDGKGDESPHAQTNEYHESVLQALEQQEQQTLKKIISRKAKKVRTNTEKDW